MSKAFGIINFAGNNIQVNDMQAYRPIGAFSFLGRYRVIDFPISNMSNSGIDVMQVYIRRKPRSLVEHLGTGRHYNINSKRGKLVTLFQESNIDNGIYSTDIAAYMENIDCFDELIYLNIPSIIDELSDETINLNKLPVLLKLSQDKNDLNGFDYTDKLPKKVNKKEFSLNPDNFSNSELKEIEHEIEKELRKIYNLDFDLEKFYRFLSDDEKLIDSIDFCNGLRLFIAKDPFECIISSICSANNSIARWTKSVDKIKSNWGNRFEFDDGTFYDFPAPNQFLDLQLKRLMQMGIAMK